MTRPDPARTCFRCGTSLVDATGLTLFVRDGLRFTPTELLACLNCCANGINTITRTEYDASQRGRSVTVHRGRGRVRAYLPLGELPVITDPTIIVIEPHRETDEFGERLFVAYWLDHNTGPGMNETGTRGQVFYTNLNLWREQATERGKRVIDRNDYDDTATEEGTS